MITYHLYKKNIHTKLIFKNYILNNFQTITVIKQRKEIVLTINGKL